MKAGKLRHAIYILRYLDTLTPKADRLRVFEAVPPVFDATLATQPDTYRPVDDYAGIEPLVGRELVVARGLRADVSHKITLRFRPDVREGNRIAWVQSDTPYVAYVFELGPEVNLELRGVEMSFYAYAVR